MKNYTKYIIKLKKILIGVLFLLSFSNYGQTTPNQLVSVFFDTFAKNTDKAVDELYETNPWSVNIKEGIENIKKEINSYTVDYVGEYYGHELITKKQFSESYVQFSYMIKYDRQPIRFTFKFYKPKDKWRLYSFKIDADLAIEIEEAAKLYFLNLD